MMLRVLAIFVAPCGRCRPSAAQAQLRGHGGPVRALAISPDGDAGALRQLRHLGDPLVAAEQRRRAGAALPRRRGQRGRISAGRPDRHQRRGCAHRDLAAGRAAARDGARRPQGAGRGACGVARRRDARVGVLGPHRAAVAARRRRAARDRGPHAERQRRRVHARRPRAGHRGLRRDAAHLAACWRWRRADRRPRCRRRSIRSRSRPTARSSPPAPTARSMSSRPTGELDGEIEAAQTPIIAVALSPDGRLIAAAGIRGSVAIIDRASRKLERTLVGPGLPVWSVAFFPDGRTLLTGGTDRMIRRWDAVTGEPIGDVVAGRAGRSARGLRRRSRRRGVSRLRRLPHLERRRGRRARARRWPAFSGARSRPCPATISPTR